MEVKAFNCCKLLLWIIDICTLATTEHAKYCIKLPVEVLYILVTFDTQSCLSSIPPDGNDGLNTPNDSGYRWVTENPWLSQHTAAIQTGAAFWLEKPLTAVICCVNLQFGPVWLLSGFCALGQKRGTPCPPTKALALMGADKACWWRLFRQLNLFNNSKRI